MSKTPYEIRLELLTLAKEILQAPIYEKRSELTNEYHSKLTDANRGSLSFPTRPARPTPIGPRVPSCRARSRHPARRTIPLGVRNKARHISAGVTL